MQASTATMSNPVVRFATKLLRSQFFRAVPSHHQRVGYSGDDAAQLSYDDGYSQRYDVAVAQLVFLYCPYHFSSSTHFGAQNYYIFPNWRKPVVYVNQFIELTLSEYGFSNNTKEIQIINLNYDPINDVEQNKNLQF